MKIVIAFLFIALLLRVQGGGNCVQAFCSQQVAECRSDDICVQNINKCSNDFRKKVSSSQKSGAYKGTEHALDDFNYCMTTNSKSRAINSCQSQYCNKKTLLSVDIRISEMNSLLM